MIARSEQIAKQINDPIRHVELDVDIGADAKDWSAIQATEKLKPVEADLRRMEEMVSEIVSEMDYLRSREQKLRDTNESTNNRVKWFGFSTTFLLIGLWVWQVLYLRAYFRCVQSFPCLPRSCAPSMVLMRLFQLQIQASYLNAEIRLHDHDGAERCLTGCPHGSPELKSCRDGFSGELLEHDTGTAPYMCVYIGLGKACNGRDKYNESELTLYSCLSWWYVPFGRWTQ